MVEEEQFGAAVGLEELDLTVNAFPWFVDGVGILCFQPNVLRVFRLLVLRVHVNDAEDMVVASMRTTR